ncbi:MAG: glycerophosphodiester phosphodiesterase, partial [Micromonosporaceae bacterium]
MVAHRYGALAAIPLLMVTAVVTISAASRGEIGLTADVRVTSGSKIHPAAFTRSGGTVTSVAHRGASGYAPENTIPAVRLGQRQDADLIEIDVHLTRDDVLVVMHDAT